MTMMSRPGQDARKSIDNEVKQNRGCMIALSQAPAIDNFFTNVAINGDHSVATRDQLHNTMNIRPVKAFR